MFPMTILSLMAALMTCAAMLLPGLETDSAMQAKAENFRIFREAAISAFTNRTPPDDAALRAYLPTGYQAMGEWHVAAEGRRLYVYAAPHDSQGAWIALLTTSFRCGVTEGGRLSSGGQPVPAGLPDQSLVCISVHSDAGETDTMDTMENMSCEP